MDQIEFANVIVISKCDLVTETRIMALETFLRHINPTADFVRATHGAVPLDRVFNTQRFSEQWAAEHQQWLMVPRGQEVSETEEYGFSSTVFSARRPFHPERLMNLVQGDDFDGVVRSKGLVWLASRHQMAGQWSQAGNVFSLHPAGSWAAATPREDWPEDEGFAQDIADVWQEPYGDRRTELVLIGQNLDRPRILNHLNACLLTDSEFAAGPEAWESYSDTFGDWDAEESPDEETPPLPTEV
jgi:G3E family GTPase